MNRDRILNTATTYFIRYGIKGVGMSMIADGLGISKRTLYFKFADKEQLVAECVSREINLLAAHGDKLESESRSQIEALITICHYISNYSAKISPSFIKDTLRYHKVAEKIFEAKVLFHNRFESLLSKGAKNDLFSKEVDSNRMASIIIEQLEKIKVEYQLIAISTLIRGICTAKGLSELEKISIINSN